MQKEQAAEEITAALGSGTGGADDALEAATAELQMQGVPEEDDAEAILSEVLACTPKTGTLCADDAPEQTLQGDAKCCAGLPTDIVTMALRRLRSSAPHRELQALTKARQGRIPAVSGPGGRLDSIQNENEEYCLKTDEGLEECEETQQIAGSLNTDGTTEGGGTTVVSKQFKLQKKFDSGTKDSSKKGRAKSAGMMTTDNLVVEEGSEEVSVDGDGVISTREAVLDRKLKIQSDMSVSDIKGGASGKAEVHKDLCIQPEPRDTEDPDAPSAIDVPVDLKTGGRLKLANEEDEDDEGEKAADGLTEKDKAKPKKIIARCRSRCKAKDKIKKAIAQCLKRDPEEKRTEDAKLKAKFVGNGCGIHDCRGIWKACVRTCVKKVRGGKEKDMAMKIKQVKAEGGAAVISEAGASTEVEELEILDDKPGVLAAEPLDDDANEKSSLEIKKLKGLKKKVEVGLDTRNCKGKKKAASDKKKRSGVKLPSDGEVTKMSVMVAKAKSECVNGRAAVEYSSPEARRLSASTKDSPPYEVLDETGADVTSDYKACCFDNGYGVATKDADVTTCPKCDTVNGVAVADDLHPAPSSKPAAADSSITPELSRMIVLCGIVSLLTM